MNWKATLWFTWGAFLAMTTPAAAWERSVTQDQMTDEISTSFRVFSTFEPTCAGETNIAALTVSCSSGEPQIHMYQHVGRFRPDVGFAKLRFDQETPFDIASFPVAEGKILILDGATKSTDAGRILEKLQTARRLLIQQQSYGCEGNIYEFDVSGLAAASGDELTACLPGPIKEYPETVSGVLEKALECQVNADPTGAFLELKTADKIDFAKNVGYDSLSCFDISGGVNFRGMRLDRICGFS